MILRGQARSGIGMPDSIAALAERAQVGPVDVLHGEEVAALGLAEVEDLHHVRVVELRGQLRLAEEHLHERRVLGQVRQDALDHQRLLEAQGPAACARNTSAMPPVASLRMSWYLPRGQLRL